MQMQPSLIQKKKKIDFLRLMIVVRLTVKEVYVKFMTFFKGTAFCLIFALKNKVDNIWAYP